MIDNKSDVVLRLQNWYASMCNDDWEHTYGIFISNIDNPGWSVKVELAGTYLYSRPFPGVKVQRDVEDDWVICRVEHGSFQGYGGPSNLEELLAIFLNWAEENG